MELAESEAEKSLKEIFFNFFGKIMEKFLFDLK